MAEIFVPNEAALRHNLAEATRVLDRGAADEPQLIASGILRSVAHAFMEKCERKGFLFIGDEACGDLFVFYDPTGVHESAARYLVLPLITWLQPWSTCESASPPVCESIKRTLEPHGLFLSLVALQSATYYGLAAA